MLKKINLNNATKALILLFAFSLVVRVAGIWHNLDMIRHPDEPTVIRSALGLRFDINPGHFDWPHLYIYVNYFAYMLFSKFRAIIESLGFKDSLPQLIWGDMYFYLITRFLSTIFGALSVFPIYSAAKNLFNNKVGILAAASFVVVPFHIWHSQYSLSDVVMMFFLCLALYYSTKIYNNKQLKDYLLAGLFVGFAASTKYNGVLVCLSVILATFFGKSKPTIQDVKKLFYAGLISIVGFLIGTPFALFDFKTFIRTDGPKGALWQFTNVGSVSNSTQVYNFLTFPFTKLAENTGYTIMLFFLLLVFFVIYQLFSKNLIAGFKQSIFILVPAITFMYYIAGFENNRAHYYFIAYPYFVIGAAYMLNNLINFLKDRGLKDLLLIVIGLYFAFPLIFVYRDLVLRNRGPLIMQYEDIIVEYND